jgi:epoxyqueuosine reductase
VPGVRRRQGRFREELGLTAATDSGPAILALAREAGFHRAGFVLPERLARCGARLPVVPAGATEWSWTLKPELWSASRTVLVCCLSTFRREPDDVSAPGDPHARIAPFARANLYRQAVRMLRSMVPAIAAALDIPAKELRLFANSRLPEKAFLAASGLGAYGRNSLTIVPGLGSMFVIAGAIIPVASVRLVDRRLPEAPEPCGACRRCESACPTRALESPWILDAERCLQSWAGRAERLSPDVMEAWGARLYGCQVCQEACPHNNGLSEEAPTAPGRLGPSLSIKSLLSRSPGEVKDLFKGTQMGMPWIHGEALLRNALLAAGHSGEPSLRDLVARHCDSASPVLQEAARWALARLGTRGRGLLSTALREE